MDSGASGHVYQYIQLFTSVKPEPISVKFPNGTHVHAYYSGTVSFFDSLYLQNVLYIPQFQFNLVSVFQLTKSLNSKVIFSHGFCERQDQHTLQMIGRVETVNNLYILRKFPRIGTCNNSVSTVNLHTYVISNTITKQFDTWHTIQ